MTKDKATTASHYLKSYTVYCSYPGLTLFFISLIIFNPSIAQSFNEKIYKSYVTGEMSLWDQALQESDGQMVSPGDRYDYALACYGLIGYWIGEGDKGRVREYLDKAELIADQLIIEYPNNPRYLSLRSALCGFRLQYQPQKAPVLIQKASRLLELARVSDLCCPEVWIETGNKEWLMPSTLGGSRIQGIHHFEKAISLMEKDSAYLKHNWFYLKSYKLLIERYQQVNMSFQARITCEKLLRIEPDFLWAANKMALLIKE